MEKMNCILAACCRPPALAVFILAGSAGYGPARAEDPTVPSEELLKRLQLAGPPPQQAITTDAEPIAMPVLKLKALVLSPDSNGSALIEASGRSYFVRLQKRSAKEKPKLEGFSTGEVDFTVEDYSASAVLLRAQPQNRLIIVK